MFVSSVCRVGDGLRKAGTFAFQRFLRKFYGHSEDLEDTGGGGGGDWVKE